jgi:nitrogen fixation NifU-like protein
MDLYADNILDHFRSPRGKQSVASPSVSHEEKNLSCGDGVKLSLTIEDDRITEMGWEGTGCAISQAGMSMLCEELSGKTLTEAASIDPKHMLALLGVPIGPRRMKCALLGLHTLHNAIHELRHESTQGWQETIEKPN